MIYEKVKNLDRFVTETVTGERSAGNECDEDGRGVSSVEVMVLLGDFCILVHLTVLIWSLPALLECPAR